MSMRRSSVLSFPSMKSNMEQIMQRYSLQQKEKEFTIAAEIYLAKFCTEVHYTDLMHIQDASLVSSNQLLSWLNDHSQSGRKGFLNLYLDGEVDPTHFKDDGTWLASYLPDAMEIFYRLTQDKDFISTKSIREAFLRSFSNDKWVVCAAAICGLKIMEIQGNKGLLMSTVASELIGFNARSRAGINKFAGIVGRAAKNNELHLDDWMDGLRDHFKLEHHRTIRTIELLSHPEYRLFLEIGEVFHDQIIALPRKVQGDLNK